MSWQVARGVQTFTTRYGSRLRQTRVAFYRLRRNGTWLTGMLLMAFIVGAALLAPRIAPYPGDVLPQAARFEGRLLPPSSPHLFGTDDLGRDVLSRVMFGLRISLLTGLVVITLSATSGTLLGFTAGYYGGVYDEVLMRVTDVFMSIPALILAIVVVTAFGPGLTNAMFAVALTLWPAYARLSRIGALAKRDELYVRAARAYSASNARIIFKHILPNSLSPLIVQASFDIGRAILVASALGFLGLGARPPSPELGLMVSLGRNYMPVRWWYSTFPGLVIMVVVLALNLIGDGLRDIFGRGTRQVV